MLIFVVVCGGILLYATTYELGTAPRFAIAVGKTDGQPAVFGADILSLKPITYRRISGRR
jgi:hypothetical protein